MIQQIIARVVFTLLIISECRPYNITDITSLSQNGLNYTQEQIETIKTFEAQKSKKEEAETFKKKLKELDE